MRGRGLTLILVLALLVAAAGSLTARGQEPVFLYPPELAPEGSEWVNVDGVLIPLAPGTTVQVEIPTFTYPPDHPGSPEGSVWVEVDGMLVPLAPGTTVQVEIPPFTYPPDHPGSPEGSVWVEVDGMLVPLAPGVSIPLEEPQELLEWPESDVPALDAAILLDVPLFNQNDPAWKNNVMQTCGQTIGAAGCALTSAAMVFKYYGAVNKNPGQLNTCLGNSACPIHWDVAANSCSESKATWVDSWSFSYSKLQSMLSADRPPIVKLVKGSSTHFVVVRSGSGSQPGNYQINDPWDGMVRSLSYYTSAGWTPDSIREFARR